MSTTQPPPSTRKGKREERDAARRERLLATGLEVFGTQGYASSAIEGLCAAAGVGTSSFYAEFASKEALLLAVYDRVIAEVGGALGAALAEPPADLERYVSTAVAAFVGAATVDERLVRVQVVEVVGVSPALEAHRREVLHAFAATLAGVSRELHGAGLVEEPLDHLVALGLVGAANELLVEWVTHRPRPSTDAVVAALTRMNLGAMRGA